MKRFKANRFSGFAALEEEEVAVVCEQQLPVMLEVFEHLLRPDDVRQLLLRAFDFDDATGGLRDAEQRLRFVDILELVGREQSAVGLPGAAVLEADEAADLGLERMPGRIKQLRERPIA